MNKQELRAKTNEFLFNEASKIIPFHKNDINVDLGYSSTLEQINMISALIRDLEELGYEIDHPDALLDMSLEDLKACVYDPLLSAAKESKGAEVEHRLLFKGFPDSVKAIDLDTLSDIRFFSYFSSIFDYIEGRDALADGSITREILDMIEEKAMKNNPQTQEQIQNEKPQLRQIKIAKEDDFFKLIKDRLSARAALSPYMIEMVKFAIENFPQDAYMPSDIPFKETKAFIDEYNFKLGKIENIDIKSFNDYERLLAVLSGKKSTLDNKTIVKNFNQNERKKLYAIFEMAIRKHKHSMLESAQSRNTRRFINNVLTKRLHFDKVKNGYFYQQFLKEASSHKGIMSKYENYLKENKFAYAALLLSKHHPTLLVQHGYDLLNKAYQDAQDKRDAGAASKTKRHANKCVKIVQDAILDAIDKADIKTVLNFIKQLEKEQTPYRFFITNSDQAKITVKENKTKSLPIDLATSFKDAVYQKLIQKVQNIEMNGEIQIHPNTKVYIDKALGNCPLNTSARSETGKTRCVATGTYIPMPEATVMRSMLYKQADHNQFIDYSALLMDENYQILDQVAWNNLKTSFAYHSGDTMMCSGPGATEVIDFDLEKMKEKYPNARYIGYTVHMWNKNPIDSCNKLFAAFLPQTEVGKEYKTIDPAKVECRVDITGSGLSALPFIYDTQEKSLIMTNINLSAMQYFNIQNTNSKANPHFELPKGCECLEKYESDLALKCFAITSMERPTILDLAQLYATAKNAVIVDNPEKADVIFSFDRISVEDKRECEEQEVLPDQKIISAFDSAIVNAELLTPKIENISEQKRTHTSSHELIHDTSEITRE